MTNKELIKKLLDFPMEMEVIIDNDIHHGEWGETKCVAYDDGKQFICITNYD